MQNHLNSNQYKFIFLHTSFGKKIFTSWPGFEPTIIQSTALDHGAPLWTIVGLWEYEDQKEEKLMKKYVKTHKESAGQIPSKFYLTLVCSL